MKAPPQVALAWRPAWRLVSSRFPPVGLFDRVAAPTDLEAVYAIEALTNTRLRDELGELALVPAEDRVSGPGTTPIMAAFTHLAGHGSRFSDGSYGVYYAARSLDTAIAETVYHRERFLAATREAPTQLDMRSYFSDIAGEFHDLRRGGSRRHAALYAPDPADYGAAQAFAGRLRESGSNGIAYDSVRDAGGECLAVFRPRLIAPVAQGPHYCYVWDGERIAHIYVKTAYERAGTTRRSDVSGTGDA